MMALSVKSVVFGKWLLLLAGIGLTGVLIVIVCNVLVTRAGARSCHSDLDDLPEMEVGLVLGCAPKLGGGRTNLFFTKRIDAAAELFRAGKVQALIVSGDNHREGYDEPTAMKEALVAAGVPEARVYCDYAGFRTLDSVVRAGEIFGQKRFIVISQRFHNERAIYLARKKGLEAVGYNAPDVPVRSAAKTYLREKMARVKAVLDVTILGTEPKFLGEPVHVALD